MDESEHSDEVDRRLWRSYREILRVRVLEMLARSHDNVSKQTSFIETDLRIQISKLFSELVSFIGAGATDREVIDRLAFDKGMISARLEAALKIPASVQNS